MKSISIAGAAIAATVVTLGSVSLLLGAPDRLLGQSYERALAAGGNTGATPIVAAAHEAGSEHFWLTRTNAAASVAPQLTPAVAAGTAIPLTEIKQAIAVAVAIDPDRLDVVGVQEVLKASIGSNAPAGRSLLVTARIAATERQPARLVKLVIDAGTGTAALPARAL
jgi:hypothetical protein